MQYPHFADPQLESSEADTEATDKKFRTGHYDIDHAATLYNDLMDMSKTVDDICNDRVFQDISASLSNLHEELKSDWTAALWLQ